MKAYKLLWLADRYHLRQYGRTITGDTYFALPLGLIPSDAKNILEKKETNLFPEWKRFEEKLSSKDEPNGFKVNIDDFFKNVEEESLLFNDDKELLELTKQIYQKTILLLLEVQDIIKSGVN
jgi:hypothetical protein